MVDLVRQLREAANKDYSHETLEVMVGWAADEIERLRKALKPFGAHAHCTDQISQHNLKLWCGQARIAMATDQQNEYVDRMEQRSK